MEKTPLTMELLQPNPPNKKPKKKTEKQIFVISNKKKYTRSKKIKTNRKKVISTSIRTEWRKPP